MKIAVLIVPWLLLCSPTLAQPSRAAGEQLYGVCAGCHGFLAEGNELVAAPALAGQEPWYLARQMRNFTAGIRGKTSGDVHGQRMAVIAGAIKNERDLEDLLAYIATLPRRRAPLEVEGDVADGRQRYAVCSACHGAAGEGSEATSSPALAGLDDWYIVAQLRLFADGLRGAHPDDTYGQQMRALAGTFADEDARRNLAAFLRALER